MHADAESPQAETELATLVQEARQGEAASFDRLVRIFWEDIYRMIFFRTYSEADGEDLTQEVFLRAYNNLARLKDPGSFKSWLYSIAMNLVRDHLRKRRLQSIFRPLEPGSDTEPALQVPDQGPPASELVERRQFWAQVSGFCQELPRGEREVFTLRFMDQLNLEEISQVLGKSPSAVKTHLYRAVGKLRRKTALVKVLQGEV